MEAYLYFYVVRTQKNNSSLLGHMHVAVALFCMRFKSSILPANASVSVPWDYECTCIKSDPLSAQARRG